MGHAIDKKGDQEYQKVRNNTDDGEEDLDINLKWREEWNYRYGVYKEVIN